MIKNPPQPVSHHAGERPSSGRVKIIETGNDVPRRSSENNWQIRVSDTGDSPHPPVQVGLEMNGSTLELHRGQTLIVSLSLELAPPQWKLLDDLHHDKTVIHLRSYQKGPHLGRIEGITHQDWSFRAIGVGTTVIRLNRRAPWERTTWATASSVNKFQLTMIVR